MNATGRWALRLGLVLVVVLIAAGIRMLAGPGGDNGAGTYVHDSFVMGTVLNIKVKGADREQAIEACTAVVNEARRLHADFDPHDEQSSVSELNRTAKDGGGTVPVDIDMARVLAAAIAVRDSSGRSFDPELGDIIDLWGFSDEDGASEMPDTVLLAQLTHELATADKISLNRDSTEAIVPSGAGALDVGGIAKGYAVDRAIEILDSLGIENALVNLGGEIGVLGVGSNGRNWRVGVQHPRMAPAIWVWSPSERAGTLPPAVTMSGFLSGTAIVTIIFWIRPLVFPAWTRQ